MLTLTKNGPWKIYWGVMALPEGSEALGTVKRDAPGDVGALIRLASGYYVQGNAGSIRTLPQSEVEQGLARSEAAAALGSIRSEKKTAAVQANGRKGGRPRNQPGYNPWPSDDQGAGMNPPGYTAWASNDQGASTGVGIDYDHPSGGARFTSVSAAAAAARSELGKGWKVHIVDEETHQEVKTFTIRK